MPFPSVHTAGVTGSSPVPPTIQINDLGRFFVSESEKSGYDTDTMTGDGFRALASTRLNEMGWSTDVIERQLAHAERGKMMQAWAD